MLYKGVAFETSGASGGGSLRPLAARLLSKWSAQVAQTDAPTCELSVSLSLSIIFAAVFAADGPLVMSQPTVYQPAPAVSASKPFHPRKWEVYVRAGCGPVESGAVRCSLAGGGVVQVAERVDK